MKILAAVWKSPNLVCIGFVASESETEPGRWRAHVAVVPGFNERDDEQQLVNASYIADWGARLTAQEAAGFFPQLDITQYKYEDDY
jgi:hypothetical protein